MAESHPITICEIAFDLYVSKFKDLTKYTERVAPHLSDAPDGIPLLVDSNAVLMMAWHEDFLKSLLSHGIQHREPEARAYLRLHGVDGEPARAPTCDLPELLGMGRRRVKFKKRAAQLERLFVALFDFPLWPNADNQNRILDLNVLRQLIVHHGGASLGEEYWDQLADKGIVSTTQYDGLPPIRRIDYTYCLKGFMTQALLALVLQAKHVHQEMLARPQWVYKSIL